MAGTPAQSELEKVKLCLLDAGPAVALLDSDDQDHHPVVQFLTSFRVQFVTTGAVLTEAFHLLSGVPEGPALLAEFLHSGNIRVADCFSSEALKNAATLMNAYSDTPMDFADATLVIVAGRLGIANILTLDQRGFRTFRYNRHKQFRLVLQDANGCR